mgnify:CR=1 FL=1
MLDEIGVQDLPIITAWNKIDACTNPEAVRALAASRPDVVAVSGATGEGLEELLQLVADKLAENMVDMQVGIGCGGWWGGFKEIKMCWGRALISTHECD